MKAKPNKNAPIQLLRSPQAQKVFNAAKKALEDPAVRAKVAEQAKGAAQAAQAWWQQRPAGGTAEKKSSGDDAEAGKGVFGQKRLEARTRHVAALVQKLSEGSNEANTALGPVREGIDQVAAALELAAGLPILKRKLAHREIDDRLDAYERMLLAAALPSPSS